MDFVSYDTCEKLILISGEVNLNTNEINIQGSTKTYINKISPLFTFIFACSPHKDTFYILSEYLVSCILQAYLNKKRGGWTEVYKEG